MPPHQQRVIDELNLLDDKCAKLDSFLFSTIYKSLDVEEQIRLQKQLAYMSLYKNILEYRINSFK